MDYTPAQLRTKIVDLWQAGKLVAGINVFRWKPGTQSDGTLYSIIWKTFKLDFSLTHCKLYGKTDEEPIASLLQEFDADMTTFANVINNAMPWPADTPPEPSTADIDDAYNALLEIENE